VKPVARAPKGDRLAALDRVLLEVRGQRQLVALDVDPGARLLGGPDSRGSPQNQKRCAEKERGSRPDPDPNVNPSFHAGSCLSLTLSTNRQPAPDKRSPARANGQGGREHGQKCDQLPGGRDLGNEEHRKQICEIWGISPDELPRPGVDIVEIFRKIDRDEIRGLLTICCNPLVSLPDNNAVRRALEKLEFYVAIDFFLSETGRYAHVVLPGSLHEEDEGTVTQIEGRVIKINKAVECPGEAREDWKIIQDIARGIGRGRGLSFGSPREIFEELRVATRGTVIDYSGITYEKIERQNGVFWPCRSEEDPGTQRLFEPGSWNPVARGAGPFYWPQDEYVSRRDLVKFMVLTSLAFVSGHLWLVVRSFRRKAGAALPAVAIASIDELPVGGSKVFAYPEGSPLRLLVRTAERAFVAYDQQCTHLQCPVLPRVERGELHCPCHNGSFDLSTGLPIAGPPRRPLTRIRLEIRGTQVYAVGVEEGAA
jgi:nitrite reductase/ring-hydroxylating ferredoxin subunit